MDTSTKPLLQPVDELLQAAVDHEDRNILLAQASDHLSLVISKSAEVRDVGQALWLEDCQWVLVTPPYIGVYSIAEVTISYSVDGYWTAKEPISGKLLRWPSKQAYFIRFISVADYQLLCSCLDMDLLMARKLVSASLLYSPRINTFLERVAVYFSIAPGFYMSNESTLVAPPDYASIDGSKIPAQIILEIPPECRVSRNIEVYKS